MSGMRMYTSRKLLIQMKHNTYSLFTGIEEFSPVRELLVQWAHGKDEDKAFSFRDMSNLIQAGYKNDETSLPDFAETDSLEVRAYSYGKAVKDYIESYSDGDLDLPELKNGWRRCLPTITQAHEDYISERLPDSSLGWTVFHFGYIPADDTNWQAAVTHYCVPGVSDNEGPTWQVAMNVTVFQIPTGIHLEDATTERVDHIIYRTQEEAEYACKVHAEFDYRDNPFWDIEEMITELRSRITFDELEIEPSSGENNAED